jgi:hypothetical protein
MDSAANRADYQEGQGLTQGRGLRAAAEGGREQARDRRAIH